MIRIKSTEIMDNIFITIILLLWYCESLSPESICISLIFKIKCLTPKIRATITTIPGEDGNNVFAANEILTRVNLMMAYDKNSKTPIKKGNLVYVIGGGNVAMDTVRTLRRLGMEAHIMYRRSLEELPARKREVEHAMEEGIIFDVLKNPKEILLDDDNNVIGMEVSLMELGEVSEDGRKSVKDTGKTETIKCDMVVMALGTSPNHETLKDSDIELDSKGLIVVSDLETSIKDIYAGGDIVTGSATVISAMEQGKLAAKKIIENN